MAESQQFYRQEEVEGILRIASRATGQANVSREQLLQIAGEVGLNADQVANAERQFAAEQLRLEADQRDAILRTEFRRTLKSRLIRKMSGTCVSFLVIAFFIGHGDLKLLGILGLVCAVTLIKKSVVLISKDVFEERFQEWKLNPSGEDETESGGPLFDRQSQVRS